MKNDKKSVLEIKNPVIDNKFIDDLISEARSLRKACEARLKRNKEFKSEKVN